MTLGLQWIVDKITFPSPPSSYSLTSHPELFFVQPPKSRPSYPGVPCMVYPIKQGAPVLLVHAHSNGCDIGDMRQTLQSISESLKVHVMSFEFPGYGLHMGTASMRSIDECASAVVNYIVNDLKINLSQVVWYGRSIGSGPALRAVHRITKEHKQQPGGVVLQCGFANFPEVAGHLFGRVAKRLVSRLWPNEAMMKELHCPVLLIHGRNDTMIPIQQSEKLWNAVSMKELSHFHTCDCGHNDFNFRRCTLRPIYDFLLGVISASSFPATNFQIDIAQTHRAYVHHIGPLRSKIPVYSFRRPDLEDWLRRISNNSAATKSSSVEASKADTNLSNNASGATVASNATDAVKPIALDELKAGDSAKLEAQQAREMKAVPSLSSAKRSKSNKRRKGQESELPPIPDFSAMPAIEDVTKALLDSEGLVRTCAGRVALFLERIQRQLEQIDGLENKSLEEMSEYVESEFWASDPLLCLWEEVSLPSADHVRYRLGPFSINNQGQRTFLSGLSTSSSIHSAAPQFVRVPLWNFCPSQAHFRCLAEWSLVNSDRLKRQLPSPSQSSSGSCCCMPHRSSKKKTDANASQQPTKGSLSTALAAHFVTWVEKNEDIRAVFERFTRLYSDPEEALRRPLMSPVTSRGPPPMKEVAGDMPVTPGSACSKAKPDCEEQIPWPPNSMGGSTSSVPARLAPSQPLPWQPSQFSSSSRQFLLEGIGSRYATFVEIATRMRSPTNAAVVAAERQEGQPLPNLADFQSTTEYVADPELHVAASDRYTDWAAAGLLLHYERLLAGAGSAGEAKGSEEATCDPTRPDLRCTGQALNKAMKAFANADLRERREAQRPTIRAALPSGVPKPSEPDGDVEASPPADEAAGAARSQSATHAVPSSSGQVEGL
eukprot:TRINITY_DN3625_c0_g2_i1.p1 TRINITY_DN3625_c0_g2~~TRINITY_DN3625_c0_g2_i1.p1  ORF type:complete len:887 (-),score=135.70 TRINITY_DN3625_c0_g2_i1:116-2776(-)